MSILLSAKILKCVFVPISEEFVFFVVIGKSSSGPMVRASLIFNGI